MSDGPVHPATDLGDDALPPGLPHERSYILPDHRVMFISVAKNACTSLKWMLARLSDQDPQRFYAHNLNKIDITQTIHRRSLWKGVPRLTELTPEQRTQIHPDNGWFVFGVVRDPRARLFSAWQSKLLSRAPGYLHYRDEDFYPKMPTCTEDVVDEFGRFVRFLADEPEHRLAVKDSHFLMQTRLLAQEHVTYSRIYDVRQLGDLVQDLQSHLDGLGRTERVKLTRENPTPLEARQVLFDGEVRALVESRYAADFEQFGHLWDFDRLPEGEPDWPKALFESLAGTAAAYEQIHSLSQRVKKLERELARARRDRHTQA